jgi:hypothetical protein
VLPSKAVHPPPCQDREQIGVNLQDVPSGSSCCPKSPPVLPQRVKPNRGRTAASFARFSSSATVACWLLQPRHNSAASLSRDQRDSRAERQHSGANEIDPRTQLAQAEKIGHTSLPNCEMSIPWLSVAAD